MFKAVLVLNKLFFWLAAEHSVGGNKKCQNPLFFLFFQFGQKNVGGLVNQQIKKVWPYVFAKRKYTQANKKRMKEKKKLLN